MLRWVRPWLDLLIRGAEVIQLSNIDDSVNAFATMGGFVYITTGLLEAADNEAELASVLAHKIGHMLELCIAIQLPIHEIFRQHRICQ